MPLPEAVADCLRGIAIRGPSFGVLALAGLIAGSALSQSCAKRPPAAATGEPEAAAAGETTPPETEPPEPAAMEATPSQPRRRQVGPRLATYYLSAGDEIRIAVYGYDELDRTLQIPPDGRVYYPMIGEIDLDGMSIPELRELITTGLRSADDQRIAAGDHLLVRVYRHDLETATIVPSSGRVTLPLAGEVEVVGLTVEEANRAIAEKLTRYVVNPSVSTIIQRSALPGPITNPHVSVEVLRFGGHKILVLGEVRQPGVYLDEGGTRLLEIVARAGGPSPHAQMKNVALIRPATETSAPHASVVNLEPAIQKGDFSKNLPVQMGDVVYVPRTTIANVAQFLEYVFTIVRPFVEVEKGIWFGQRISEGPRTDPMIIFE